MKTSKLIKLSDTHYIVVDDSEIKGYDWYFDFITNQIQQKLSDIKCKVKLDRMKITHSNQPLEQSKPISENCGIVEPNVFINIKPLSLSEVEEAINGYSVEKMAEKYRNIFSIEGGHRNYAAQGYIDGFNAHKELVKDKHEEIIELLTNITEWSSFKEHPIGKQAQKALDLLLPKTEWEVEFDENGKLKLVK